MNGKDETINEQNETIKQLKIGIEKLTKEKEINDRLLRRSCQMNADLFYRQCALDIEKTIAGNMGNVISKNITFDDNQDNSRWLFIYRMDKMYQCDKNGNHRSFKI